jgi:hypothetical protein
MTTLGDRPAEGPQAASDEVAALRQRIRELETTVQEREQMRQLLRCPHCAARLYPGVLDTSSDDADAKPPRAPDAPSPPTGKTGPRT